MIRNFLSDFDYYLPITDCAGNPARLSEFDWELRFFTECGTRNRYYIVSHRNGVFTNCVPEGDGLRVIFQRHGLLPGRLLYEPHLCLPNELYKTGVQHVFDRLPIDIELVDGHACWGTSEEITAMLPYIKGDTGPQGPVGPQGPQGETGPQGERGPAFVYEDFTPEEIAELQRPATEAAGRADEATEKATAAALALTELETTVSANETTRQGNEQRRIAAESKRVEAEASRETQEGARQTAEVSREKRLAQMQEQTDEMAARMETVKMDLFIDEFNARCVVCSSVNTAVIQKHTFGGYDPENAPDPEHPFLLNGLWLSYEEAIEVMRVPDDVTGGTYHYSTAYCYSRARTFFPIKGGTTIPIRGLFGSNPLLEVVVLSNYYITNNNADINTYPQKVTETREFISQCPKLREVRGILSMSTSDSLSCHFYNTSAPALETLWIHGICLPTRLQSFPALRVECVAYMIEHAANTTAITVTVHADMYAKLTGDTTNAAAAALTAEELAEWQQVLADAVAKNISFATV